MIAGLLAALIALGALGGAKIYQDVQEESRPDCAALLNAFVAEGVARGMQVEAADLSDDGAVLVMEGGGQAFIVVVADTKFISGTPEPGAAREGECTNPAGDVWPYYLYVFQPEGL